MHTHTHTHTVIVYSMLLKVMTVSLQFVIVSRVQASTFCPTCVHGTPAQCTGNDGDLRNNRTIECAADTSTCDDITSCNDLHVCMQTFTGSTSGRLNSTELHWTFTALCLTDSYANEYCQLFIPDRTPDIIAVHCHDDCSGNCTGIVTSNFTLLALPETTATQASDGTPTASSAPTTGEWKLAMMHLQVFH